MEFTTTMSLMGRNTGIEVPAELIEQLGAGKKPPVIVSVNGYTYASTVGVMGGRYLIPFSSDRRKETGIEGGDTITVTLQLDTEPRTTEVPSDLAAALDASGQRDLFDALSPSARKAHVTKVEAAKAAATRERRIAAVLESLS
ncbi:MAG: YdeI/OmpD-associated family protein [Pseudoclavibacter sp.]